jgi:hypothetical protein
VIDLAGLDDISAFTAPAFFNHVRFGIYFKDLSSRQQKQKAAPLFHLQCGATGKPV